MSLEVAGKVKASKLPTVVINDTHRLAPWADALYACDAKWWLHHAQEALRFEGLKITQDICVPFPQVLCLKNSGQYFFDPDPANIRTGHNSGYQALHVVVHGGAKRVLLCGFDMRFVDGRSHFFGDHPGALWESDRDVFSRKFIPAFWMLAPILSDMGVEVVNCTPNSALHCFKKRDLDEALKEYASGETADIC